MPPQKTLVQTTKCRSTGCTESPKRAEIHTDMRDTLLYAWQVEKAASDERRATADLRQALDDQEARLADTWRQITDFSADTQATHPPQKVSGFGGMK